MPEFPVIDISHKPRRYQSDNLLKAGTANSLHEEDTEPVNVTHAPRTMTLESAIHFYETNAKGDLASLYIATARWLRNYMTVGNSAVRKAVESEESTNEISESHEAQADPVV